MASQPYLGAIFMFAGNFAPRGYQLCQGQVLAISSNAALFSILGTTYGGNGTSTFQLPDLRGRFPLGQGNGPGLPANVLGESAGNYQVTVAYNNMPLHTHALNASTAAATQNSPGGCLAQVSDSDGNPVPIYVGSSPNATLAANAVGNAGGNVPLNIQNPYLCMNFIIAITGIFPTRN